MNYTVDWTDPALDGLAAVWTQAADRRAVNDAETRIDRLLASDPYGNGIHLSEGMFVIEVAPLHAQYEISDADRVVSITYVRGIP